MERRDFFKKATMATAAAGTISSQSKGASQIKERPTQENKPHVILIMTDQQRFDTINALGNKSIITPNLNKLVKDGFTFSAAYASVPSSCPARAGLLTGKSPWNHGLLGFTHQAEEYGNTKPRLMKKAGYYTACIGKNHFKPSFNTHGYDKVLLEDGGPRAFDSYGQWFEKQIKAQPFLAKAIGWREGMTDKEKAKAVDNIKLSAGCGWNDNSSGIFPLAEEFHPTHWVGDNAVKEIENYNKENPLFLKVSFHRPHSPNDPPKRVLDMYENITVPEPAVGDWVDELLKYDKNKASASISVQDKDYVAKTRKAYYANITFVDEWIGNIISALKAKGMYDNALILFTSDHGDMMGDHHHWRKTYAYEGSSKIPLLVKCPQKLKTKLKKGSIIDKPVELRDVLPTFLDAAGSEIPKDIDGKSLLSILKNDKQEWRNYIDLEHSEIYFKENHWTAVTDGKIKYIFFASTGKEQLFDLSNDPLETKNLAKNTEYKKTLIKWRAYMISHLEDRGDEFVKNGALQIRGKKLKSPNFPNYKKS